MNQGWETKEIENQPRLPIFNLNLILTCNKFTKEPIRELLHTNMVRTVSNTGISQVLTAMGRMTAYGDVRRRLFETLHFVKEVVLGAPGDIKAECMRVRLLHAAVRYYVQHHDNRWEVEKVSAAKEKRFIIVQVPVVQKVHSAIHQISLYPLDSAI